METSMSKFTSLIRRAPKRFSAVVLVLAAAIIIPTATFAWGPNRDTFTIANPSDHVQFNSITNNPNIGDERNFVGVREKGSANTWYDSINAKSGKTYIVRMYVHNNAATSLNLTAKDVKAKVNLPTTTGKEVDITGFVSTSNAGATKTKPGAYAEVYDNAKLTSTQNFNVAYVPGSLRYENNTLPAGTTLPESIFTSAGAKLGYDKLDGNIPGCFKYAGYVSFEIKPQFATPSTYTMSKMVSKHGEDKWVEDYTAKAGEKVDYLLEYKNTGSVQHDDVTFRDTLPKGMTYINGSTLYGNSKNPNGVKASDSITNGTGINVGSYAPGANAWAIFTATAPENDKLSLCGPNKLVNTGKVTTGGTSLSDTANITVSKECLPGTINVCELSTKKVINIKESDFNASKHSKNLDDCKVVPTTPPELPKTGVSENIVAVIGLGALIASIAYYVASRRALVQ